MYIMEKHLNNYSNTVLMVVELQAMSMKLTVEFWPHELFPGKLIRGPFCSVHV